MAPKKKIKSTINLDILRNVAIEDENRLTNFNTLIESYDEEELYNEEVTENIIFDQMEQVEGYYLEGFTNLSSDEIMLIFDISKSNLTKKSRGPQPVISPIDSITLMLYQFKNGYSFEEISKNLRLASIKLKSDQIKSSINNAIEKTYNCIYDHFVKTIPFEKQQKKLPGTFFPTCGIVDCTVIPLYRPSTDFETSKEWFSGKHHIYCSKFQALVDLTGLFMDIKGSFPGARHDFDIFKEFIDFFKQFCGKKSTIRLITEEEEYLFWALMLDSGYMGADSLIRCFLPYKESINHKLTTLEKTFNKLLSSKRVVIEMAFGRMKKLYHITNQKWSHKNIEKNDKIMKICTALTNLDIIKRPLINADSEFYWNSIKHFQNLHLKKQKKRKELNEKRKLTLKKLSKEIEEDNENDEDNDNENEENQNDKLQASDHSEN